MPDWLAYTMAAVAIIAALSVYGWIGWLVVKLLHALEWRQSK